MGYYTYVSYIARELSNVKKAIFKEIGDRVAEEIEKAYEELLIRTPQWTGTMTASWNLELAPRLHPPGLDDYDVIGDVSDPKYAGHLAAVNYGLQKAQGALDDISTKYTTHDIYVNNNTPWYRRMETGDLRPINATGFNAHLDFEDKIRSIDFDIGTIEI